MSKDIKKDTEIVEEVNEEVVQAVVDAIVDEALEQGKTTDEIIDEIVEESKEDKNLVIDKPKKNKKKYIGDLRGFSTYEEAVNYPKTEAFSKLDKGCQAEYKSWLKTIM